MTYAKNSQKARGYRTRLFEVTFSHNVAASVQNTPEAVSG